MRNICSVDGCGKNVKGRGLCNKHYCLWYYKNRDNLEHVVHSYASDDPKVWKVRFDKKWKHDDSTGCWQWTGTYGKPSGRYNYRYGQFLINGDRKRAHRVSWELHRGAIPDDMQVLHKCNNALCVNPEHLYLGTHEQNMKDMATSLRSAHLKLMPEQVREIRTSKESARILATRYSVDKSTIKDIKNRKTRYHVS